MKEKTKGGKRFNIIVSLFLAVLLWLYVINVVNPNATMSVNNVPVSLYGVTELEANNLIVTGLSRELVKLKVSGKRKAFLQLNASQVTIKLDVSKIKEAGEHSLTGEVLIADASLRNLLSISEAESFSFTVTVKQRESKEIPVQAEFSGSLADGFEIDTLTTQPTVLHISGPEDVISEVSHAVVLIQADQVRAMVAQEALQILLVDGNGNVVEDSNVKKSVNSCKATMTVLKVFELPLTVLLVPGGGAQVSDAQLTITPPGITVSGSEALLESLTELNLGRIELADIFSSHTQSFPIVLPPGLRSHSEESAATVFINMKELPLRAMSTTNIELLNVPDGYEASLINPSIQVWLRGDESTLNSITAGQIRVLVNLAEITPARGQQRAPASVYLDIDTPAGIVGSDYSVAVLLER